MDAYIYQADWLCAECAESLINCEIKDLCKEDTGDSDDYPQGPHNMDFVESDSPCHCGDCQEFLENSLTQDGIEYVTEAIETNPNGSVTQIWADYYDLD